MKKICTRRICPLMQWIAVLLGRLNIILLNMKACESLQDLRPLNDCDRVHYNDKQDKHAFIPILKT